MYQQPVTVPSRHIPARLDEDFDLIVGELIVRFLEKTEILKQICTLDIRHKIETGSFFLKISHYIHSMAQNQSL
jgi:hypothetical protein